MQCVISSVLSLWDRFECLEKQALKNMLLQTHLWATMGVPIAMGGANMLVGTPTPATVPWGCHMRHLFSNRSSNCKAPDT